MLTQKILLVEENLLNYIMTIKITLSQVDNNIIEPVIENKKLTLIVFIVFTCFLIQKIKTLKDIQEQEIKTLKDIQEQKINVLLKRW